MTDRQKRIAQLNEKLYQKKVEILTLKSLIKKYPKTAKIILGDIEQDIEEAKNVYKK